MDTIQTFQFYRETEFKEAELGGFKVEIPTEWELVNLEEVAIKKKGAIKMGPFGSQLKKSELVKKGPIKVYGQENVIKKDFTIGARYITIEKFKKLKNFEILPEDVLVTMMGSVGYATVFPKDAQKGIMDSHLLKISVDTKRIYPEFLAMLLNDYSIIKKQIRMLSQGAIMSGLNTNIVKKLKIPLPPLEEQRKIAHVLMSIDKAIEAVEEAIAKAERIKKGLMQELLTKGIGHTEFKDTEIGRIPKEWEVVRLGGYIKIYSGSSPSIFKFNENGEYLYLKVDDLNYCHKYVTYSRFRFNKDDNEKFEVCPPGTIVFPKRGAAIFTNKIRILRKHAHFDTNIMGLQLISKELDNEFLFYYLLFIRLDSILENAGVPQINNKHIHPLKIPLPPLPEQQKIAEILSKWDEVIEMKKAKKDKLERMKKKVMELLLTGKVRVK